MSELKQCPFCAINDWQYHAYFSGATIRQCGGCGTIVDESVINTRPIEDALNKRIADLDADNAELKERVAMLDVTAVYKSLGEIGYIEQVANLKAENAVLQSRIAELKVFIDQLVEAGDDVALVAKDILEFDGKSGEFMPIAEKWQALGKDWKEG